MTASPSELPPTGATTTAFFAHERASTSLQDLDVVRKIVEREGCLEALTQLLTSHARATRTQAQLQHSLAASATLAAAPMVVQSLLDQLRGVSVQIVEGIDQWKRAHRDHRVFQWRGLNYLAKMLGDTDFVALHGAAVAQLPAFQGLRLQRNPFLAPLHLDHAALREPSPEMACRLALFVGNVDMKRIYAACRRLLEEEYALSGGAAPTETSTDALVAHDFAVEPSALTATATAGTPTQATPTRVHWSHRPMKLALSASAPSLQPRDGDGAAPDPREAMAFDVELAKELVFQHEHELGAMKEELAVLQRRLQKDLLLAPDKKRALTTRVAALSHDVKLRTGDLFHRRNELQRKEAVLRMDRRRVTRAKEYARVLQQQQQQQPSPSPSRQLELPPHDDASNSTSVVDSPRVVHFTALETFKAALQADELRRQDLVDKFATLSKLQASVSVTKRRLQSLTSPHRLSLRSPAASPSLRQSSSQQRRDVPLEQMTAVDVERFVGALPLGEDARRYAELLRAQDIDGQLLAQAEESDLAELGVAIRLHRVKILEAVRRERGGD